jgi:hypothetical protein
MDPRQTKKLTRSLKNHLNQKRRKKLNTPLRLPHSLLPPNSVFIPFLFFFLQSPILPSVLTLFFIIFLFLFISKLSVPFYSVAFLRFGPLATMYSFFVHFTGSIPTELNIYLFSATGFWDFAS